MGWGYFAVARRRLGCGAGRDCTRKNPTLIISVIAIIRLSINMGRAYLAKMNRR